MNERPSFAPDEIASVTPWVLAMAKAARAMHRKGLADLLLSKPIPPPHIVLLLVLSCDPDAVTDAALIVIASGLAKHQHGLDDWREDRALALALLDTTARSSTRWRLRRGA
jgi:hypothetical protein